VKHTKRDIHKQTFAIAAFVISKTVIV